MKYIFLLLTKSFTLSPNLLCFYTLNPATNYVFFFFFAQFVFLLILFSYTLGYSGESVLLCPKCTPIRDKA